MRRVHVPARAWIAAAAVLLLVAAHGALLSLFIQAPLSVTLAAGAIGLLALKYVWWRSRH